MKQDIFTQHPLMKFVLACVAVFTLIGGTLQAGEAKQPKVGGKFAEFELEDLNGEAHKLSDAVKEGNVVLLVLRGYPGYQCPLCTKQVARYLAAAEKFAQMDAQVILIYPGEKETISEYAQEFVEGTEFPENFTFLIDPDYKFLNANALRWDAERETSYPSTFVIGKDQKVIFAKISQSHGGRTKPVEALAALKKQ